MIDLLTSTVSYVTPTLASVHGDPTYGSPVTIAARVEHARRMVRTGDSYVYSSAVIFTVSPIPVGARVWTSDESSSDATSGHPVIASECLQTPDGSAVYYEATI